jgi:hypothetical protein
MMRVYNYTAKYVSVIQKKNILRVVIWKPTVKSKYIPPNVPFRFNLQPVLLSGYW